MNERTCMKTMYEKVVKDDKKITISYDSSRAFIHLTTDVKVYK